MKVTTFAKASVSVAAAAALTCGLATTAFASAVTPTAAEEDAVFTQPIAATTLVGVGSDTTQDVMYGVAKAINLAAGSQKIASFSATGTGALTFRSGKTFAAVTTPGATVGNHPNGSGAGYKALTDSIGLTAAGNAGANDVDFARASGTQGVAATTPGAGVTTDVPFAVDTMSIAVPAGSPFLATNGGNGLTITDLAKIYGSQFKYIAKENAAAAGAVPAVVKGTLATAAEYDALDVSAKPHYEAINAFLPKVGSGSREFFLKQLATQNIGAMPLDGKGAFGSTATPVANTPYVGEVTPAGAPVQEHDATALTTSASSVAAISPFSGAKFIGYHNLKIADPDSGKKAGADYVLVPLRSTITGAPAAGVLPYTGDASSVSSVLAPNADYKTYAQKGTGSVEIGSPKLFRDVYNIIPTKAATATASSSAKLQALKAMFVGASSLVCSQPTVIAEFGFLPASNCGNTDLTFDETPSTATATITGSGTAGQTGTVNVTVASNGNGGGAVSIVVNGITYTGTIAANAIPASTNIAIPTPVAGTLVVTGTFTPALPGVRAAQINGSITVAAAPAPAATLGSVKITGKVKVGKTVKAAVAPAGLAGVKYQWYANGKKVKGATKVSYKVSKKLKKKKLTVKATYAGVTKTSAAVKVK